MENNKLYPRMILKEIKKYLKTDDVIVLHGARQVGKTSILYMLRDYLESENEQAAYVDLEDFLILETFNNGPDSVLNLLKEKGFSDKKRVFLLADEIQYLKNPTNFMKLTHDHFPQIKLIVSGSSSFEIKNKFKDSLVGRTVEFEIFPLNFQEFMTFSADEKYTNYNFQKNSSPVIINELKELYTRYLLYGGYPKIVLENSTEKKEKYLQQIINTYLKKDIRDLADIRETEKFNKLLETLARQSGNILNVTELANTVKLSRITVEKYLFIMENTYIIKLVRPFSDNLRSELFKTPKIFFYDTGLMHLLSLKTLPKTVYGNSLETSVFSELIKKFPKENVYYWRTKDKKEIDFILREKNKIIPIEVKNNFQNVKLSAINYFREKYSAKKYFIIGTSGNKNREFLCYPWEIPAIGTSL